MEQAPAADLLRAPGGRVRLGWRLLFFSLLTFTVGAAATLVLPLGQLAGSTALLVGALTAGVLMLAVDGRPATALGFPLGGRALGEGARGLALGLAVGLGVVALLAAGGGLAWERESGDLAGWLTGALGALAFLAVPAAAEEALLRGYPLQAMTEAWGPGPALGLTAVAFGALHLGNPNVTVFGTLNVAGAGIFLGIVYLKTLSLWWATGAHLGWNWAHGYLADVPVSGLELIDAPLYEGYARGPDWLGGGSYGPEGSVVATAVVIAAAVWCWKTARLRPGEAVLAARPLAPPLTARGARS
jgi:hypothetical protein